MRSKVKDEWPHINKFPCTQACISVTLADYSPLHLQDSSMPFVSILCRFHGSLPTLTSSGCFCWYLAQDMHLVSRGLGGGRAKGQVFHKACVLPEASPNSLRQRISLELQQRVELLYKPRGLQVSGKPKFLSLSDQMFSSQFSDFFLS